MELYMAGVRYIGYKFASSRGISYTLVHEMVDFSSSEEQLSGCISIDALAKQPKFAGMVGCISDRESGL
jgi:hypothetical protein